MGTSPGRAEFPGQSSGPRVRNVASSSGGLAQTAESSSHPLLWRLLPQWPGQARPGSKRGGISRPPALRLGAECEASATFRDPQGWGFMWPHMHRARMCFPRPGCVQAAPTNQTFGGGPHRGNEAAWTQWGDSAAH